MRMLIVALVLSSLTAGCASQIAPTIRSELPNNPLFADVQRDAVSYTDRLVRWGGTIVGLRNDTTQTVELEILARPLQADGQPEPGDTTPGRFLIRSTGFLDPEVYKTGRRITVYGTLKGTSLGRIGERDYVYPLVLPLQTHVWRDDADGYWRRPPISIGVGVGFGF
jgi:outer membrane lipoprotein